MNEKEKTTIHKRKGEMGGLHTYMLDLALLTVTKSTTEPGLAVRSTSRPSCHAPASPRLVRSPKSQVTRIPHADDDEGLVYIELEELEISKIV
jgi:hypothetical protein